MSNNVTFNLHVKILAQNKTLIIKCNRNDSILQVKQRIHDKEGIPPHWQQLFIAILPQPLEDNHHLSDYNICQQYCEVSLQLRNRPSAQQKVAIPPCDQMEFSLMMNRTGDALKLISKHVQFVVNAINNHVFVGFVKDTFVHLINKNELFREWIYKCGATDFFTKRDKIKCISQIVVLRNVRSVNGASPMLVNNVDLLATLKNNNYTKIIIKIEQDSWYRDMVTQLMKSITFIDESKEERVVGLEQDLKESISESDEKQNNSDNWRMDKLVTKKVDDIMNQRYENYDLVMKQLFGINNGSFNQILKECNYDLNNSFVLKGYFFDNVQLKMMKIEKQNNALKNEINSLKQENDQITMQLHKLDCTPSNLNRMTNDELTQLQALLQTNLQRVAMKISQNVKDAMLCVVCLDNKRDVLFQPCGHLYTCKQCSDQLTKCPICNATIKQKLNVFF